MANETDNMNKIEVQVDGDTIILQNTELGVFEFKNLFDVPDSYTGQGKKLLQVKEAEDGIEFALNSIMDLQVDIADSDLENNQAVFYLDEVSNLLKIKVKYSDGTIKTGSIALS